MTKFYLASDLHLEFGSLVIENRDNVDCLILAGDVTEIEQLKPDGTTRKPWIADDLKQYSKDFKHVIWVPGNHEYYDNYFMQKTIDDARQWLKQVGCDNIVILDNESTTVGGIPIHGSTLWTDMRRGDPVVRQSIQLGMNDYRYIRGATPASAGTKINTQKVLDKHKAGLEFLDSATANGVDCIVVTHHQPTLAGLGNHYEPNDLDYAYASDLSEFFLDRKNIRVWCSGHTHVPNRELVIGEHNQRFLTNCRGYYGHEHIARNFAPMLFVL